MPNIHLVSTAPKPSLPEAHTNPNLSLTGNISNATASAKVSGGMVPEGSADASGPLSADAGTTTSNQGGLKGAIRNLGIGSGMRDLVTGPSDRANKSKR